MLKKTISYVDFNGEKQEETFLFNISKAEMIDLQVSQEGGYGQYLQRIIDAKDQRSLISTFKELLLLSYGVKSDDGKRFIKNDTLREDFQQHAAFHQLYHQLATDDKKASDFVNALIPPDLLKEATGASTQPLIAPAI